MALRIVGVIKNKNKIVAYDILDTITGDTNRFSKEQVINAMSKKTKIENARLHSDGSGIRVKGINCYTENKKEFTGLEAIDILRRSRVGIPLKVKMTQNGKYKQVLYDGNIDDGFYFYDEGGLNGIFGFTERFIVNNPDKVKFKFRDNDPTKVAQLIESLEKDK